jgi:hypothetical protein
MKGSWAQHLLDCSIDSFLLGGFCGLIRGVSQVLPGGPRKSPKSRRRAFGGFPGAHGAPGAGPKHIKTILVAGPA